MLLVVKFGGTSMGGVERIEQVAQRVQAFVDQGHRMVVVVSAMAGETDRLLSLAHELDENPEPREVDALLATGEQASSALLSIALNSRGVRSQSMSGNQMGVRTDGTYRKARIRTINASAVKEALAGCSAVVATGFQGIDDSGNLTTLGRGGSDTSAVALAAALGADECQIFTDVLGVYTADPRICPNARKLDAISFDEMMEMASQGSKVLQIRSVEMAMNHNIPLRVRSTFSEDEGTLVKQDDDDLEKTVVRGVSHDEQDVKLTLRHVPDQPGIAAAVFTELAEANVNVDVIVQNTSEAGTTDLSFTVPKTECKSAEACLHKVREQIQADAIEVDPKIAKVSIVGVGMRSNPGVAATMFRCLREAGINIQMITTSEIKVTCVIQQSDAHQAVRALHGTFQLGDSTD